MNDPETVKTLKNCGLLKFFWVANMQAQKTLLHMLIIYWVQGHLLFDIDDDILTLEVEDIYFLIGLSHWGESINLPRMSLCGGTLTIEDYIDTYYLYVIQKMSLQVPIRWIEWLPCHAIISTILHVLRSMSDHLASCLQMYYVMECLHCRVYDYCSALLDCIQSQLIEWRIGR